jgi:uncharacterized protein YcbK (DUF882 family)
LEYAKDCGDKVSKYFKAYEFDCPCSSCNKTIISEKLLILLDKLRDKLQTPVRITSGYRCKDYQKELSNTTGVETSIKISQHELGEAADLKAATFDGWELEKIARDVGFRAVGTGKMFVHVDTRPGKIRSWKYSY